MIRRDRRILRYPWLVLATTLLSSCAFPVEGRFWGRELPPEPARPRTIVVIFNHGFSRESAGTFQGTIPPVVRLMGDAPDVVVYSQVRNTTSLQSVDHSSYIESAVRWFNQAHKIPIQNIILVGQSCGGWGSLQAAAFTYPNLGGVVAFAPTCHGQLPHSSATRDRRASEIAQIAGRIRFPAKIFVYEGDSYYNIEDWNGFEDRARLPGPVSGLVRVSRERILQICPGQCDGDSHGAASTSGFALAYSAQHIQPLMQHVRNAFEQRAPANRGTSGASRAP